MKTDKLLIWGFGPRNKGMKMRINYTLAVCLLCMTISLPIFAPGKMTQMFILRQIILNPLKWINKFKEFLCFNDSHV